MDTLNAKQNFRRQWNDGRRGQDGWDRYTRRRKWCRDAELVEVGSGSADATSGLTQALAQVKEVEGESGPTDASTADSDAQSLAPSTASNTRRRRWFGGSKSVSDKSGSLASASPPCTNPDSSVDVSKVTSSPSCSHPPKNNAAKPINIPSSRQPSQRPPGPASRPSGSSGARDGSSAHGSDSASLRDKEITQAQDRLDRWGTRATGGTERAEREMGLGDEVNMGLS